MLHHQQTTNALANTDSPMIEPWVGADRWVATLAHELRNPLTAMMLSLGELKSVCPTDPAARLAQIAMEVASHMARVIDDTLDLCRSRHVKLPIQTERVDLARVVTAALRSAHPFVVRRRHSLSVSLPSHPVVLLTNPSRLQQILTNLLINAAKYTKPGGEIFLTVQSTADLLVIKVRDNGMGMTPDVLSQLFKPHWQRSSPPPDHGDGLGIGLAIVKLLAELHGGSVSAHSEGPGKGAEFVVRLPDCVVQSDYRLDLGCLYQTKQLPA